MRNKRIDEFRIAHVFGAIAIAVALYGIWLAAAALLDLPTRQARAAQAANFWTAPASRIDPAPLRRDIGGPGAVSFWQPRAPAGRMDGSRLAGDFVGARGQL